MNPNILSIGTASPQNVIDQKEVLAFMIKAHGLEGGKKTRLQALYRATGIQKRHTVISDYQSGDSKDWKFYPNNDALSPFPDTAKRAEKYREAAIGLSAASAKDALAQTHLVPQDLTHLITISCTGMYAPGLDIDLVHALGLSTNIERTSINFMGCYAAFNGLKVAQHICNSVPNAKVLMVATELCTIHFQKESNDDNLLANAIFGDGSAAVILSNRKKDAKRKLILQPQAFHNDIYPQGASEMAWNIGNFGFEMKLSAYVPDLIEAGIGQLVSRLMADRKLKPKHYAIHPGGKRILEVIEQELNIEKVENFAAREVLKTNGNMSSPTLLFVLQTLWQGLDAKNIDEEILALAFGPGLTLEAMILSIVENDSK